MGDLFQKQKQQALQGVDFSRKGSVDEPIADLVTELNSRENFFTTSSCSGRVAIVENVIDGQLKKSGCKWLYMSHERADSSVVIDSLKSVEGDAVLKFEPFVLHVQCRTLKDAQTMLADAVASGFRNSGISIGKKEKIIMAVRSTHGLEVPLSSNGKILVSNEYIQYCVDLANSKMDENFTRIKRFNHLCTSVIEKTRKEQETNVTTSKDKSKAMRKTYSSKNPVKTNEHNYEDGGLDDNELASLFPE